MYFLFASLFSFFSRISFLLSPLPLEKASVQDISCSQGYSYSLELADALRGFHMLAPPAPSYPQASKAAAADCAQGEQELRFCFAPASRKTLKNE
jgi:hypothetical protein